MAFSGKSEQRAQLSVDYAGGKSTLQSNGVKMPKDNYAGGNGPSLLYGKIESGKKSNRLYGRTESNSPSGLAGEMSAKGYTSGPKHKMAMEPGELKPGNYSQKGNTVRLGKQKDINAKMHKTGSKPKELKGGNYR